MARSGISPVKNLSCLQNGFAKNLTMKLTFIVPVCNVLLINDLGRIKSYLLKILLLQNYPPD